MLVTTAYFALFSNREVNQGHNKSDENDNYFLF